MSQLKAFFKLMRWPNIALLAFVQWLVVYSFMPHFTGNHQLAFTPFILLLTSICSIAIGGNLLNDMVDQKTDAINRPKRTQSFQVLGVKKVRFLSYFFFMLGNLSGIFLFFYTSFEVVSIFFLVSILLWLYSYRLKGKFLIGNVVVSLLVSLSLLLPGWIVKLNFPMNLNLDAFYLLFTYAGFAFLVNLIREIVKDTEDVVGDYACKHTTLPIVLGKNRTNTILQILISLTLSGLVWAYFYFFPGQLYALIYIFALLIGLGLFIFFKTHKAKSKMDYQNISKWIKIWMFLGVASLFWH